jgi:hypothetical protein
MAQHTFTHLYDTYDEAARTYEALLSAGVPKSDISLVANNVDSRHVLTEPAHDQVATGSTEAGTGAEAGTLLGGAAGLLTGLGMLAIPGVGPVVAAGWLVATLTGAGIGAAGGGLIGSLVNSGVTESHAHVYAEGVRRGGTLLSVRADESQASEVETVLNGRAPSAVNVDARRTVYEGEAWTGHSEDSPALTAEQLAAERNRYHGIMP